MTKTQIFGALAMAFVVVLSNYLVQIYLGNYLTYGAFTYPLAFLVTDLMNRIEGPKSARRIVFVGFVIGIICSLIGSQIMGEFGPLVTFRVALASGTAFLVAQLLDILVFNRLRKRAWWQSPIFASIVGSTIDSMIFFSIAFSTWFIFLDPANDVSFANVSAPLLGFGFMMPFWISMALADYLVKLLVAVIALIPYRQTVKKIEAKNVSLS